jgi:NCAIR mutase (PurE)-related protein
MGLNVNLLEIEKILKKFKEGEIEQTEVLNAIKSSTIESLEFAQIDYHRELRQGFPEVIFCKGKSKEQVKSIAEKIYQKHGKVLATRAEQEVYDYLHPHLPQLKYNNNAKVIHSSFPEMETKAREKIAIITAGTSDVPVAEEAVLTCQMFGYWPIKIFDVGVAGLHRLNNQWNKIKNAQILVVVAGMEGALASVIGGLVDKPVIAVPTSIGYGTSFGGLTALFAMLNSCASNIVVVNINNGFGAGFTASLILRQIITK